MLAGMLLDEGRYQQTEEVTRDYLLRVTRRRVDAGGSRRDGPSAADGDRDVDWKTIHLEFLEKAYVESLYRQGRDSEVLAQLDRMLPGLEPAASGSERASELALFRAAASCRENKEGWVPLFEDIYLNQKTSEILVRAYRFLIYDRARWAQFSPCVKKLILGRYQVAVGNSREGVPLLEGALACLPPARLDRSPLIKELGFGYSRLESYRPGAEYLDGLSKRLRAQAKLDALELAGRLYRRARLWDKAVEMLRQVSGVTEDDKQRDRCFWFTLDIAFSRSVDRGLRELGRTIDKWSDPPYFDDTLEEQITDLAGKRDWETLATLADIAQRGASGHINRRIAYLLGRNGRKVPERGSSEVFAEIAGIIAEMDLKQLYYAILQYPDQTGIPSAWVSTPEADAAQEQDTGSYDALALGFFEYGFYAKAYRALRRYAEHLSPATLREGALRLSRRGYVTEAMRIMALFLSKKRRLPSVEEWRIAYPMPYKEIIEELAAEQKLPGYLIYATIREESFFNSTIRSAAGATGLMQLMPATAEYLARQMNLENIDLLNPEHNLTLGCRYLGNLYRRFDSMPLALMAYNAGPTRVRRWNDTRYAGLTSDQLAEAVPIYETRHYIRKVLVSAIIYAMLYDRVDPAEVIKSFYPALR